jgi:hypothetical protein
MLLKTGLAMGVTMSLAMVVAGTMCEPSTDSRLTRRSPPTVRRAPLIIGFDDRQIDLTSAAVRDLAFLAGEARADPGLAVLVHGFARDEEDFGENLRLAESRARAVARVLTEHGAPAGRVLLAAAEHADDGDGARRCEVELVRAETAVQLRESLQVARAPGDSHEVIQGNSKSPD